MATESLSGKTLVSNFLLFQNKVGQDKVKKFIPGMPKYAKTYLQRNVKMKENDANIRDKA